MKKYKILICGENFILDLGEGVKKYGFYVNSFCEADNENNARILAMDSINQRKEIQARIVNTNDNLPILKVEEITEIDSFDTYNLEQGIAWFLDED